MPSHIKIQALHMIRYTLPSTPFTLVLDPLYKYLPSLEHCFLVAPQVYFHPPQPVTTYCFNVTVAQDFVKVNQKYASYNTSFSVASNNATGVLDNSANIHVLKDKSLFISTIEPCPINTTIGTIVGSNPPQGVGTARIAWKDHDNKLHHLTLYDALYYPDSPANIVSITKLGPDNADHTLNIQTFSSHSIFTWNHSANSMILKHSAVNLPELSLATKYEPLAVGVSTCLAKTVGDFPEKYLL